MTTTLQLNHRQWWALEPACKGTMTRAKSRVLNECTLPEVVVMDRCGDIRPFYPRRPCFEQAHTVFLMNCDKNFVYYWLRPEVFPRVQRIYLASHPCEPIVFERFSEDVALYLVEGYKTYKDRWAAKRDNVRLMSMSDIETEMNNNTLCAPTSE